MGRPKADLVVAGTRLLDRAVGVLTGAGCAPVLAVVREGMRVQNAGAVVNPDPERGMRSSLMLAIDATPLDVDALAVLLVDTPGIGVEAVREVLAAWQPGRITVARFGERRGHPTVMSPQLWRRALARATADEGARAFVAARPDLVDEIEVSGDAVDLDTPDDLARWEHHGGHGR